MRILAYFLSLSILLISCITCEDVPEFTCDNQLNIAIVKSTEPANSTHKDDCSPMCTCNCCGQPTISSLIFSDFVFLGYEVAVKQKIHYSNRFISAYIQNIWQPPKLNKIVIG
ncbi:hypothetical protein DBR40_16700 [Pedobacter sp. KBW01]|uniref:hypothetical protein n=1 Tax=Pedobacter sp. KBW01 TaxID=2153364 RepID=UPI000F5A1CB3|nr:hypothetical protein [Pedobacter sp. KBW01]RQO71445.1 hypothetical protein DBR40_16700 [Pedobacter sp. KBW01]